MSSPRTPRAHGAAPPLTAPNSGDNSRGSPAHPIVNTAVGGGGGGGGGGMSPRTPELLPLVTASGIRSSRTPPGAVHTPAAPPLNLAEPSSTASTPQHTATVVNTGGGGGGGGGGGIGTSLYTNFPTPSAMMGVGASPRHSISGAFGFSHSPSHAQRAALLAASAGEAVNVSGGGIVTPKNALNLRRASAFSAAAVSASFASASAAMAGAAPGATGGTPRVGVNVTNVGTTRVGSSGAGSEAGGSGPVVDTGRSDRSDRSGTLSRQSSIAVGITGGGTGSVPATPHGSLQPPPPKEPISTALAQSHRKPTEKWMRTLQKPSHERTEFELSLLEQKVKELNVKYFQEIVADADSDAGGKFSALVSKMKYQALSKDEPVFWQGDVGDKMYVILSGSVSCWINRADAEAYGATEEEDEKADAASALAAAGGGMGRGAGTGKKRGSDSKQPAGGGKGGDNYKPVNVRPKQERNVRKLHLFAKEVSRFSAGGRQNYFGDIALLKDAPRTATIKTEEYCQFLTISKVDFTECMEKLKADLQTKIKALNNFHVFRAYTEEHRTKLAAHFALKTIPPKTDIVKQGSDMSHVYFVMHGECQLTYTFRERDDPVVIAAQAAAHGGGSGKSAKKPITLGATGSASIAATTNGVLRGHAAAGSGGGAGSNSGSNPHADQIRVLTLAVISCAAAPPSNSTALITVGGGGSSAPGSPPTSKPPSGAVNTGLTPPTTRPSTGQQLPPPAVSVPHTPVSVEIPTTTGSSIPQPSPAVMGGGGLTELLSPPPMAAMMNTLTPGGGTASAATTPGGVWGAVYDASISTPYHGRGKSFSMMSPTAGAGAGAATPQHGGTLLSPSASSGALVASTPTASTHSTPAKPPSTGAHSQHSHGHGHGGHHPPREQQHGEVFGEERFLKKKVYDKSVGHRVEPKWEYGVRTISEVQLLYIHFEDLKMRLGAGVTGRLRKRLVARENWRKERMAQLRASRRSGSGVVASVLSPVPKAIPLTKTATWAALKDSIARPGGAVPAAAGAVIPQPHSIPALARALANTPLHLTGTTLGVFNQSAALDHSATFIPPGGASGVGFSGKTDYNSIPGHPGATSLALTVIGADPLKDQLQSMARGSLVVHVEDQKRRALEESKLSTRARVVKREKGWVGQPLSTVRAETIYAVAESRDQALITMIARRKKAKEEGKKGKERLAQQLLAEENARMQHDIELRRKKELLRRQLHSRSGDPRAEAKEREEYEDVEREVHRSIYVETERAAAKERARRASVLVTSNTVNPLAVADAAASDAAARIQARGPNRTNSGPHAASAKALAASTSTPELLRLMSPAPGIRSVLHQKDSDAHAARIRHDHAHEEWLRQASALLHAASDANAKEVEERVREAKEAELTDALRRAAESRHSIPTFLTELAATTASLRASQSSTALALVPVATNEDQKRGSNRTSPEQPRRTLSTSQSLAVTQSRTIPTAATTTAPIRSSASATDLIPVRHVTTAPLQSTAPNSSTPQPVRQQPVAHRSMHASVSAATLRHTAPVTTALESELAEESVPVSSVSGRHSLSASASLSVLSSSGANTRSSLATTASRTSLASSTSRPVLWLEGETESAFPPKPAATTTGSIGASASTTSLRPAVMIASAPGAAPVRVRPASASMVRSASAAALKPSAVTAPMTARAVPFTPSSASARVAGQRPATTSKSARGSGGQLNQWTDQLHHLSQHIYDVSRPDSNSELAIPAHFTATTDAMRAVRLAAMAKRLANSPLHASLFHAQLDAVDHSDAVPLSASSARATSVTSANILSARHRRLSSFGDTIDAPQKLANASAAVSGRVGSAGGSRKGMTRSQSNSSLNSSSTKGGVGRPASPTTRPPIFAALSSSSHHFSIL